MTDTPDLRTLAAEAIWADGMGPVMGPEALADAVLAAVLPAHRRQVLAELADELRREAERMHAPVRATYPESSSAYALVWDDVAEHVADLAAAAPETAPRPRQDDETAPAVPEDTPAPAEGDTALGADQIPEQVYLDAARASVAARFPGRPAFAAWVKVDDAEPGFRAAVASAYRAGQAAAPDGPRTWQLPDEPGPEVTAVRDRIGRAWKRTEERSNDPEPWCQVSEHLVHHHATWYGLLAYAPLTDATPADGQDGDGHG